MERDELGIPLGKHRATCGCQFEHRDLTKPCKKHRRVVVSGGPYSKYREKHDTCGAVHSVRKIKCWAKVHSEKEPHWAMIEDHSSRNGFRKVTWRDG